MSFQITLVAFVTLAQLVVGISSLGADQVSLPLDIPDGLENMWTVRKDGSLIGPSPLIRIPYGPDCRAAILSIDRQEFPQVETAARMILERGTEIQIGPKVIGPVHVTRKVFFGKGEGQIRFLEVLENRSTTPITVRVSLSTQPHDSKIVWESENTVVVSGDGGVVTEFFYGSGGALKPTRDRKRSDILYWWDALAIQPQSKIVLLHFLGVRPKREQALNFAQSFDVAAACNDIEATDLSNIVNFDPRTLGAKVGIEIFRGSDKDAFLLKSGDKLTGTVQNANFRIQTSYAQLGFPATEIATIIYEGGASNIEKIVVLNGDVFSGFILDPDVSVKLEAGPAIKIRKEKISKLGFRIRPTEKEKYPVNHDITLTNGDHFSGIIKNRSLKIGASFGDMPIEISQIAKIEFISKKGTVTEITLKNGDKVSGFLKDEDIVVDLDFGREVSIYQNRIERIIFDKEALSRIYGEALKKEEELKKPK